ncbi:MAG TPA: hypothetical protein VNE16_06845 [Vicinamibacterales bacterium]|nr:hypothetical protein [Vicinamibacterales bacterium]
MGPGHLGIGLALKRVDRRLNAGWLVFAAYLLDFLLGIFVLLGLEQVRVPPDLPARHYFLYSFPYSHSLVASLGWSALAALIAYAAVRGTAAARRLAALTIGAAVFSHFLLDVVVHVPEIPIAGASSPRLGLGLWNHLPLALGLEAALVAIGLALYLGAGRARAPVGRHGMVLFAGAMTIMMLMGQATLVAAPPPAVLAAGWILQSAGISLVVYWLDTQRTPA